jgi:hypothetical protein
MKDHGMAFHSQNSFKYYCLDALTPALFDAEALTSAAFLPAFTLVFEDDVLDAFTFTFFDEVLALALPLEFEEVLLPAFNFMPFAFCLAAATFSPVLLIAASFFSLALAVAVLAFFSAAVKVPLVFAFASAAIFADAACEASVLETAVFDAAVDPALTLLFNFAV